MIAEPDRLCRVSGRPSLLSSTDDRMVLRKYLTVALVLTPMVMFMVLRSETRFWAPNLTLLDLTAPRIPSLKDENDQRQKQLTETCVKVQKQRSSLPWGKEWRLDAFIKDPNSNLVYCHIPKVASTMMYGVFAKLNNYSDTEIAKLEEEQVSRTVENVIVSS